jgi:hypothetical protein
MATEPTWEPHTKHIRLSAKDRKELPDSVFAFPKQHKEPLTNSAHVQNVLARFDQIVCGLIAYAHQPKQPLLNINEFFLPSA